MKAPWQPPQIEKGIQIPHEMGRPGKQKWLGLLLKMSIGDSILVDTEQEANCVYHSAAGTRRRSRKSVRMERIYILTRAEGKKFRIWRVAGPDGEKS